VRGCEVDPTGDGRPRRHFFGVGIGLVAGLERVPGGREFRQHDQIRPLSYGLVEPLVDRLRVRLEVFDADLRVELHDRYPRGTVPLILRRFILTWHVLPSPVGNGIRYKLLDTSDPCCPNVRAERSGYTAPCSVPCQGCDMDDPAQQTKGG
jgi:hypothetical protein